LNSRDRVFTSLNHEEPDVVPITDHIYRPESLERILGDLGVRVNTPEKYVRLHHLLGLDLIVTYLDGSDVSITSDTPSGELIDDWGIKWKIVNGMPWYLDGPLKTPEDLESYVVPNPHQEKWFESTKGILKLVKDDLAVATLLEGPLTKCWYLTGLQTFMKMLYTIPMELRKFISKMTKFQIELGKRLIELGIDLIWIDEDLGDVKGPLIHPNLLREFIFPKLKEMINIFKRRGVKVLLHSDGNIMPIINDIIQIGVDGLHPLERSAGMNIGFIKEKYGDKLTLIGNVDSKTVLQYGPIEKIKEQVIDCIRIAAPGGGYILASDHSIHIGIPEIHVKAMFKIAKKFGRYPNR
jgi:uroporphyrinogen decarboxylase